MNITNAQYFQGINVNPDNGSVSADGVNLGVVATIDGVTMHVPIDPANSHFAEIQKQVAAGELTIQEAD